jgi:6-phosphogluconolactonase (cycloisomerase 2 family)
MYNLILKYLARLPKSMSAVENADGSLKLMNTVSSQGAGPTYVSIHPSGRFLFVANYFGGSVAVVPILADGKLGPATDVKQDEGKLGSTKAASAGRMVGHFTTPCAAGMKAKQRSASSRNRPR